MNPTTTPDFDQEKYNYTIIDCHNLAYRSWWHNRHLKTLSGIPTGLEFGFLRSFLGLVRDFQGAIPVLAWDGVPERCLSIYPIKEDPDGVRTGYKVDRPVLEEKKAEPDWVDRFQVLRESLIPLVHTLYHPRREADEQIASFIYWLSGKGMRTLIIGDDKDFDQLVSSLTYLYTFEKTEDKKRYLIYNVEMIHEKWGVPCGKIPLFRAIAGDGSDRIPGIPRIPKKVIRELVLNSLDLDHLLINIERGNFIETELQLKKLQKGTDTIIRNYQLSDLLSQRTYPNLFKTFGSSVRVLDLCKKLEIKSLMNREEWKTLEKIGTQPIF